MTANVIQGAFVGGRPQLPVLQAKGSIQRSPDGYSMQIPDTLLRSRRGVGQPIPEGVREKMERALRADFSDVRIHVGPEASSIGALAFAHGSDIYFASGQYNPNTSHGQRLLGHELTHVVQQRAGRVRNPFGNGVAVVQDPNLEAEAERMGMLAAAQAKMVSPPPVPASHVEALQPKAAPRPVANGPAAHVAAAQLRPAPGATLPAPGRAAVQPRSEGYKIVLGSYMHQGEKAQMPEEVAGHTFVSVQGPAGKNETWGFSPANFGSFQASRDLGRLHAGVQGRVHRDESAFGKPGVKLRTYEVSRDQAQAAMAKISEYRSHNYSFNLECRQCSTFALDVARAARVDPFPGARVKRPRDIYRQL
ncbi:MAG TPA: DUF4157 domain-containing protein [Thermoanaerobaculia bacterium]|nr:DUF4157 domain-containing protein [Thermoanaerobaculia bacterium]